ncbi:hypothetical protein, partial [Streptomyces prunicolor]|uniref:hypothetical protein n=1 Tax=Streptomyces prunicolor TaxID=67348 RepID=UPI0033CAB210
ADDMRIDIEACLDGQPVAATAALGSVGYGGYVRREAAMTAATALTTALLLSAIPLALLGQAFLGHPWPAGPVWLLPGLAATVTGIAFLTIELPTRQALRTSPADAIRAQ